MGEQALTMEECSTSARLDLGAGRNNLAIRKCASTPTLRSLGVPANALGDAQDLEVYVVIRPFQDVAGGFFNRLPGAVRDGVRDCGICHYMTVFRQPDGSLVQFDYGPKSGGDIHIGQGALARLLSPRKKRGRRVEGDVREHKVR
jgi:hypothetical protein